jgi:ankyrin repeat protein
VIKDGWTPLIWATNNGHENVVKLLVERGATADGQVDGNYGSDQHKITIGDFLSRATNNIDNTSVMAETLNSAGLRSYSRFN